MRVGWSLIADQLSFKNLDINEILLDVKIEEVIYDEGEVKQWSRTIIIGPFYRCGFGRGMVGEMCEGCGLEDVISRY